MITIYINDKPSKRVLNKGLLASEITIVVKETALTKEKHTYKYKNISTPVLTIKS